LKAAFYIFFYTLFGSLPLLARIFFTLNSLGVWNLDYWTTFTIRVSNSREFVFLSTAFLIKLPIYYTHIWLPKAHVESPVTGSIILAGLILKLGGIGLFFLNYFVWKRGIILFITTLRVLGGVVLGFLILRLTDLKVIIAYSSVVHMRMVVLTCLSGSYMGAIGALLIIVAHGLTSPGIFAGANMIYERTHSRRRILNKGVMGEHPSITLIWFILLMINFGGPFSINLIREILLINAVSSLNFVLLTLVGVMCFISACYNLIIYARLNQGVVKIKLTDVRFSSRELLILGRLIWPGFLIILRFDY